MTLNTTTDIYYTCSSPGSLMILGEHSILRHKQGHILAIDKKVRVKLVPNLDNLTTQKIINIKTNNSKIGNFNISYENLNNTPADQLPSSFKYALASIKYILFNNSINNNLLNNGFDLIIDSEIPHDFGLGSSGAILTAVMGVILFCLGKIDINDINQLKLLNTAKKIAETLYPNKIQGSGYDYAASIYGGFCDYNIQDLDNIKITKYNFPFNIILAYAGYKTPTSQVLELINLAENKNPNFYKSEFKKMYALILDANKLLINFKINNKTSDSNLKIFNKYLDICEEYQNHLKNIKVTDPNLNIILHNFKKHNIKCKISGSGLGDCIIGLTNNPISDELINILQENKNLPSNAKIFKIQASNQGLIFS